jgi:hypothetical protein
MNQRLEDANPREAARQNHEVATHALGELLSLLGELEATVASVTDPATLAGEGNLSAYRQQAAGQVLRIRQALEVTEDAHGRLRDFLVSVGVQPTA